MGFFDKVKETAEKAKDKATTFAEENKISEKLSDAKDSIKKGIDESTASLKEYSAEKKELKKPVEGAIIRYEVIYLGGLPEYPKAKHGGAIGLNVMPDCFAFRKTETTKDWFEDFDLPYSDITNLTIEKRSISNTEMLLGAGSEQQTENNICITFNRDNLELVLRVEMLTGISIYGQATKCKELLDVLRQNGILNQFKKEVISAPDVANSPSQPDALEQIKKLSELKDAGVITEEEFNAKKAELLSKI